MKNILIISLWYCFTFLQQEPLSKVAVIKAPLNAEELTTAQVSSFSKANFKLPFRTDGLKHIYKIDNILVGFGDCQYEKIYEPDLEHIMERNLGEVEELRAQNKKIAGKIVRIDNVRFLVFKSHIKDEYSYSFLSEAKTGKGLQGRLKFNISEKERADQVLEDLLNTIKFN